MIGMFFFSMILPPFTNHIRKKKNMEKNRMEKPTIVPFSKGHPHGAVGVPPENLAVFEILKMSEVNAPPYFTRGFLGVWFTGSDPIYSKHMISRDFTGNCRLSVVCHSILSKAISHPIWLIYKKLLIEISLRVAGKSVAIGTSQLRLYLFENTIQSFCSFWEPMVCWRADRWWMVPFFFRRNQAKIVWDISNFLSWFRHFLS